MSARSGRPRRGPLATLLAALVLIAACTGGDAPDLNRSADGDPTDSGGQGSSSSAERSTTSAGPVEITDATLRIGLADVESLDPVGVSPASPAQVMLAGLLYGTLTRIDSRDAVQPAIASYSASADLRTWRFDVDPEATFADGTSVTAADAVYSLTRVRDTAQLAGRRLAGAEIAAVDEQTVEVTLEAPSAVLPELLAAPVFAVTEDGAFDDPSGAPTGSDDYRIDRLDEDRIVLARRRGRGAETVVVDRFATENAALDAFLAGDLDWTIAPPERLDEALAAAGTGGLVPFHGGLYLGVDPEVSPLDDERLRHAIALAVDRRALVDEVFGPTAQPLWGLIPSGVSGGATECRGEWCGPDQQTASSQVAEVFPDGQGAPLQLLVDDTATQASIGDALEQQFGEVGLDVEAEAVPVETYESLITTGNQQLFVFGWLGLTRSPVDHVPRLFVSPSRDSVADLNDDAIDDALAEAMRNPIPEARATAWRVNELRILDQVPVVPLVQFRTTGVMSRRLEGFEVRVDGTADLTGVRLEGCGSDTGDC